MTTNLNLYPYYDDYDALKDFYKILFKPGYPVQARELTQIQTILQNQVSRFGDNIFTNGSRVTGGKVTVNPNVYSVILADGQNISSLVKGQYLKGQTNGLVAEIVSIGTFNSSTVITYIPRGNSSLGFVFDGGEVIIAYTDSTLNNIIGNSLITAQNTGFQLVATGTKGENFISVTALSDTKIGTFIPSIGLYVTGISASKLTLSNTLPYSLSNSPIEVINRSSTPCLMVGVGDGVFYVNGVFARVGSQLVVPDYKNRWVTASIGLTLAVDIVTPDDDYTLLDPAQGSYNFNAPGADRLRYALTLVSYSDAIEKDPSFIELVRIENGTVIRQNDYSTYGEIMNSIARRTFDQSGNYVVDPFIIKLTDSGDPTTFNAVINPGKAYVNGFEFKTIAPYTLKIKRSQETESTSDFGIDTYLGNYFIINTVVGQVPTAGTTITIMKGTTTVGSATIIQVSPSSNGIRLYLANINGDVTGATSVKVSTDFTANISGTIIDSLYKSLVFKAPQEYVKSVTNMTYTISRTYRSVVFTNGVAVISALATNERFVGGSGVLPSTVANANYAVFNVGSATLSSVDVKTVVTGTIAQLEVKLNNTTFSGVGNVTVKIQVNDDYGRVKTVATAGVSVTGVSPTQYASLKKSDLYSVSYASVIGVDNTFKGTWAANSSYVEYDMVEHEGVIYTALNDTVNNNPSSSPAIWAVATDVSSDLVVDNGQRDLWYDHARVKSKVSTYAKLAVAFKYFKHSGFGPIVVNSYPIGYNSIPEYNGVKLRDSIDLRPRRVDDTTTTLDFESVVIADDEGVSNYITYYLSRIDKIVLSNNRSFYTLNGVSSYSTPLPPADIADAMTLATLVIPPYTDDINKIRVDVTNNKRYTMKDIGKIEQRVSTIEYYTSLNSLENKVINSVQYSPSGVELFKSGFITDSFDNFNVGNVSSHEYKCSIDTSAGICRPQFKMKNVALNVNSGLTLANVGHNLVSLPFTKEELIKNNKPSGTIFVNQFNTIGNIGVAKISPSSDYWFDDSSLPIVNVLNENTEAFMVAQQNADNGQQVLWGAWDTIWAGLPVNTQSGYTQTTTFDIKQQKFKANQVITEAQVSNSDNTIVVSKELQPYARKNVLSFSVAGLTPNSHVFVWIDDFLVNSYVTPNRTKMSGSSVQSIAIEDAGSGYSYAEISIVGGNGSGASAIPVIENGKIVEVLIENVGSNYTSIPTVTVVGDGTGAVAVASLTQPSIGAMLVTDNRGSCEGKLEFPNDGNIKFSSGSHRIVFSDTFERENATSYADVIYSADGYISTVQDNIVSTRVPLVNTNKVTDYITASNISTRDITSIVTNEDNYNVYSTVDTSITYYGIDSDTARPLSLSEFYEDMMRYYPSIKEGQNVQEILDTVKATYGSNTSGSAYRNIGNQFGLPDTKSAAYWVNQVVTGQMSLSELESTITASVRYRGDISSGCPVKDPLAQSFIISAEQFQNGCFLSEIDVFFASKDSLAPIMMEIRPLVNGFPSSNSIIPLTRVEKYPANINVSQNGILPTTFAFDDPIYLTPGEYAIILNSSSNNYSVFISEMNKVQLGTNTIISNQPYVGNLFESQNASTWTAEQFKDMCFVLRICKFSTSNSYSLVLDNKDYGVNGDLISLLMQNVQPAKTGISANVVLPTFSGNIPLHQDIIMPEQFELTKVGDARVYVTMTSKDPYVSPIIDVERMSLTCIENIINDKTDVTVPETDKLLGDSKAKYITKAVTLNQGFSASSLVAYLNINKPHGSYVEVYARFKNEFDTAPITDKEWVLLQQEHNGGNTARLDQFVEDMWSKYDFSYNGFGSFNQFEVKVVMYSNNTSKVPVISDIRVIALA